MSVQRHFTSSVYVYHPKLEKFLFIKHKKLHKWLEPGGHVEENESPENAAIREVFEETGLSVVLVGERLPTKEQGSIRPYGVSHNIVADGKQEYLDLIYLAVPQNEDSELVFNQQETAGVNWFSLAEINSDEFDTFEAQRQWTKYFHQLMTRK